MKLMKKLFLAFILLLGCSLFPSFANDQTGLRSVYEWRILNDKIFSWNNHKGDELIESWGIPTKQYNKENGSVIINYSCNRIDSNATTKSNTFSNLYGTVISTDQDIVTNISTKESVAIISFTITNGIITSASYSGDYALLNGICKSPEPSFYDKNKTAKDILMEYTGFYSGAIENNNWKIRTTREITDDLEKLSINYGNNLEYKQQAYELAKKKAKSLNSKSALARYIDDLEKNLNLGSKKRSEYSDSLDIFSNNFSIENYLAFITVYRELYPDKVTDEAENIINNFRDGKIVWNELNNKDLDGLEQYSTISISSINYDDKTLLGALEDQLLSYGKKGSEKFINDYSKAVRRNWLKYYIQIIRSYNKLYLDS